MGKRPPEARVDLPAAVPDWVRDSLAAGIEPELLVARFAEIVEVVHGQWLDAERRRAFRRELAKRVKTPEFRRREQRYWDLRNPKGRKPN